MDYYNKYFKSPINWNNVIKDIYLEKYNYTGNLDEIHKLLKTDLISDDNKKFYDTIPIFGVNDRQSIFVKDYYEYYDNNSIINEKYIKFINEEIKPLFNEDKLVVQKTPNIRFHLPNNSNIGKRDTDPLNIIGLHYDNEFNHPKEEYNIILSITDMFDTNSLYYEIYPNSNIEYGNYENLKLEKNNYWIGYLNQCKNYNKINNTGKTRISMDFRIISYSKYKLSNDLSVTSNSKFIIGDYYILI